MSSATEIPFQPGEAGDAEVEHEALDAYSRTVVGVAERLAPSVANLRITRRARGGHVPAGAGSGVVLTPDGFLLTSAHVVAGRSPRRGRATSTNTSVKSRTIWLAGCASACAGCRGLRTERVDPRGEGPRVTPPA